jgi:hypothetical protein
VPTSRPIQFDLTPVGQAFNASLAGGLRKAGLDPLMPIVGSPDIGFVIRPQVVLADPGRPTDPLTMFADENTTWFEVEGLIGDDPVPVGRFHASGRARGTVTKQDPQELLAAAARRAGGGAAKQIRALLADTRLLGRMFGGSNPMEPSGQSVPVPKVPAVPMAGGAPQQIRSPLQWQAYVRVCLFDGCPLAQVQSELAAAGVAPQATGGFVAEAAKAMRSRARQYFILSPVYIVIGVLGAWGALANMAKTGHMNYLLLLGILIPLGAMYAYFGVRVQGRVPRLPRR